MTSKSQALKKFLKTTTAFLSVTAIAFGWQHAANAAVSAYNTLLTGANSITSINGDNYGGIYNNRAIFGSAVNGSYSLVNIAGVSSQMIAVNQNGYGIALADGNYYLTSQSNIVNAITPAANNSFTAVSINGFNNVAGVTYDGLTNTNNVYVNGNYYGIGHNEMANVQYTDNGNIISTLIGPNNINNTTSWNEGSGFTVNSNGGVGISQSILATSNNFSAFSRTTAGVTTFGVFNWQDNTQMMLSIAGAQIKTIAGINSKGDIVGTLQLAGTTAGFIAQRADGYFITDLNTVTKGSYVYGATGISNNGTISADVTNTGQATALLVTAAPEPGSLGFLMIGFGLPLLRRAKNSIAKLRNAKKAEVAPTL